MSYAQRYYGGYRGRMSRSYRGRSYSSSVKRLLGMTAFQHLIPVMVGTIGFLTLDFSTVAFTRGAAYTSLGMLISSALLKKFL